MRHDPGLDTSPPVRYILEVERRVPTPFHLSSAVGGQPPREAASHSRPACKALGVTTYSTTLRRATPSSRSTAKIRFMRLEAPTMCATASETTSSTEARATTPSGAVVAATSTTAALGRTLGTAPIRRLVRAMLQTPPI